MPSLLIILTCILLSSLAGNGQQRKIDSVYNAMQHQNLLDTNRLKTLNNYSRLIRFDSATKALFYAEQAIELSRIIKSDYWAGQSFLTKGMVLSIMNKGDSSLFYYSAAQQIFEKTGDLTPLSLAIGLKFARYKEVGLFAKAIDVGYESIRIAEKDGNLFEQAKGYGDIALVYGDMGLYSEAIAQLKTAHLSFEALKDTFLIAYCEYLLGFYSLKQNDFKSAKLYIEKSREKFSSLNRNDMLLNLKGPLAVTIASLGDPRKGMEILKASLLEIESKKNNKRLAEFNTHTAKVILLGSDSIFSVDFSPKQALSFAIKGYELSKELKITGHEYYALQVLTDAYKSNGKYKEAFYFQEKLLQLKDSIYDVQKTQEIAIKSNEFENGKKTLLLQSAHTAEIKQQKVIRNFSFAGGGLILLASGLLFASYKKRRDAKAKQQEAELNAQIADTENKVMRLQMNPHFIFNSLNSIGDYIRKNDTEQADAYLAKFAKIMRGTLENSELKEVPLADDLKMLDLYMQLEAKRLNHKFTYEIKVAGDIDSDNTLVPPMLMQPFVENSIWHGITPKETGGHISIAIEKEGEMLHCSIEDNGIGRKQSAHMFKKEEQSMGMKITKARIDVLKKTKGVNAVLELFDKPENTGFVAKISLPVTLAI